MTFSADGFEALTLLFGAVPLERAPTPEPDGSGPARDGVAAAPPAPPAAQRRRWLSLLRARLPGRSSLGR